MTDLGYIKFTKDMPCFKNTEDKPDQFDIGEWTYGYPSILGEHLLDNLTIGKFCAIGGGVRFLIEGHEHNSRALSTYPFLSMFDEWKGKRAEELGKLDRREITIGHDVWIGQDAMIFSGVTIGHGSIIGAGAIVRKDVQPYVKAKGTDERLDRFSGTTTRRLLSVAWWDWPNDLVSKAVPILREVNAYGIVDIDALERMAP